MFPLKMVKDLLQDFHDENVILLKIFFLKFLNSHAVFSEFLANGYGCIAKATIIT